MIDQRWCVTSFPTLSSLITNYIFSVYLGRNYKKDRLALLIMPSPIKTPLMRHICLCHTSYVPGSTTYHHPNGYHVQPFPLDYHQTLLSLLDVLSEVYNKIAKVLGPSPFPSAGHHMMGPLGLLSPHPGVSYLFHGAEAGTGSTCEGDASLWGIAHAAGPGTPAALGGGGGAAAVYGGALGSPPPSWNSGLADTVRHIDAKLKVGGIVRHAFSVQS